MRLRRQLGDCPSLRCSLRRLSSVPRSVSVCLPLARPRHSTHTVHFAPFPTRVLTVGWKPLLRFHTCKEFTEKSWLLPSCLVRPLHLRRQLGDCPSLRCSLRHLSSFPLSVSFYLPLAWLRTPRTRSPSRHSRAQVLTVGWKPLVRFHACNNLLKNRGFPRPAWCVLCTSKGSLKTAPPCAAVSVAAVAFTSA